MIHRSFYPILLLLFSLTLSSPLIAAVSPRGDYNYALPISIPDGVGEATPSITIRYNSASLSTGFIGTGFKLSGLQLITRFRGEGSINYDGNDRYIGPEGELIPYGNNGEFRGKHNPNSYYIPLYRGDNRLTAACDAPEGEPCGWIQKVGDRSWFYGITADSRIEAVNKNKAVRVWALNEFRDGDQNRYTVEYDEDKINGDFYPKSIRYGFGVGQTDYYEVAFDLRDRPDLVRNYGQNTPVTRDKLLAAIRIQRGNQLLYHYELNYEQLGAAGDSRLTTVERVVGEKQENFHFTWQANSTLPVSNQDKQSAVIADADKILPGLWNGDGLEDLLFFKKEQQQITLTLYPNSGNGTFSQPVTTSFLTGNAANQVIAKDWDGDGLLDLGLYHAGSNTPGRFNLHRNLGDGRLQTTPEVYQVNNHSILFAEDWNGDGRLDLGLYHKEVDIPSQLWVYLNTGEQARFSDTPIISYANNDADEVLVGDFTGDGVVDLGLYLKKGSPGFFDVFPGTKSGKLEPLTNNRRSIVNNGAETLRHGDFNGDGLLDLAIYYPGNGAPGSLNYYLNRGDGVFAEERGVRVNNDAMNWFAEDWNGDRITDIGLFYKHVNIASMLNVYQGSPSGAIILPEWNGSVNNDSDMTLVSDWNGDGRADVGVYYKHGKFGVHLSTVPDVGRVIAIEEPAGRKIEIEYTPQNQLPNTILTPAQQQAKGCDYTPTVTLEAPPCGIANMETKLLVTAVAESDGRNETGWTDKNGNDQDSLVRYEYEDRRFHQDSPERRADLGFHKVREISMQHETVLATRVTRYAQFAWLYDSYRRPSPFIGFPLEIINYAGEEKEAYRTNIIRYQWNVTDKTEDRLYPLTANEAPANYSMEPYGETLPAAELWRFRFAQPLPLVQEQVDFVEGRLFRKQTTTNRFDQAGRVTFQTECLTNSDNTEKQCQTTTIDYRYKTVDPGNGKAHDQVLSQITRDGESGTGNILNASYLTYDNDDRLLRSESLYCEKTESCSEQTGTKATVLKNRTYNTNGTIHSEEDAKGSRTTYEYDPRFPNLPTRQITAIEGLESRWGYNEQGQLAWSEEANSQRTTYKHDALGRVTEMTNPAGGTLNYHYETGDPKLDGNYRKTTATENTTVTTTIDYFDGFGASYKTLTDLENTNEQGEKSREVTVVTRQESWNGAKRTLKTSFPFLSGTAEAERRYVTTTFDRFDRRELTTRDVAPGDALNGRLEYTYGFENNRISATQINRRSAQNPTDNDRVTVHQYNFIDQLVNKSRGEGNEKVSTGYEYNRLGLLSRTELPPPGKDYRGANPEIRIEYDSLGRKTTLIDPSIGTIRYQYDPVGNLERIIDVATGTGQQDRITRYEYDRLNRPIAKYSNFDLLTQGIGNEHLLERRNYDDSHNSNGLGRLAEIVRYQYRSGTTAYSAIDRYRYRYDNLGNLIEQRRELEGIDSPMIERFEHGQLGTLMSQTLPDGSKQTMNWLAGNRLSRIGLIEKGQTTDIEYARFFNYDENGKFRGKRLKNGIKSLYTYNKIGGLKELKTFCADDTNGALCSGETRGKIFQDLRYDFDSVGQIRSITDRRTNKQVNGINTDETQAFKYDSLGRLKSAWWGPESDRTERIDFTLGAGGNLESKQRVDPKLNSEIAGVHFTYDGQRVVSGRNRHGVQIFQAEYDRFGNMSRRWKAKDTTITTEIPAENRTWWRYRYDEEDRLIEVYQGERQINVLRYDSNGQRVRKFYGDSDYWIETWYLGDSMELRNFYKAGFDMRYDITRYLIAPGHGKIASITKRYTKSEYQKLSSEWNTLFASTMNDPTLPGMMDQGGYYLNGFYQHPNFFARVWISLLLTMLAGTVLLALRTEIRIIKGRETSRFARWQRALATATLIPFFLISCDSERRVTTESAANGPIITGINQAITGTTYEYEGLPEGTHYYHVNHLGSSSVITDETGRQVTRINYNPYGEIVQDRSDGKNSVTEKFTGQELDEEMDLYYYGARYYDPFTGRFLRADTIVPDPLDSQAYNRYMYVIGNPIIYDDPTGHYTGSCMMCGMSDDNGGTPGGPDNSGKYGYRSGDANKKTKEYQENKIEQRMIKKYERYIENAWQVEFRGCYDPEMKDNPRIVGHDFNFATIDRFIQSIIEGAWDDIPSIHGDAYESPNLLPGGKYKLKAYKDPKRGNIMAVVKPTYSIDHILQAVQFKQGKPVNYENAKDMMDTLPQCTPAPEQEGANRTLMDYNKSFSKRKDKRGRRVDSIWNMNWNVKFFANM